jgi:dTDP-4-dehydrorhamnose 3,5-epimerase-like enzyme
MDKIKLIEFKVFKDLESLLTPIENRNLPFTIKRIFYIYKLKAGDVRGGHTHKRCKQLFICLNGGIDVMCEDGKTEDVYNLCNPRVGLYIPPMVWTTQRFLKNNSILLVLTDKDYSQKDYIHNYDKYKKLSELTFGMGDRC